MQRGIVELKDCLGSRKIFMLKIFLNSFQLGHVRILSMSEARHGLFIKSFNCSIKALLNVLWNYSWFLRLDTLVKFFSFLLHLHLFLVTTIVPAIQTIVPIRGWTVFIHYDADLNRMKKNLLHSNQLDKKLPWDRKEIIESLGEEQNKLHHKKRKTLTP